LLGAGTGSAGLEGEIGAGRITGNEMASDLECRMRDPGGARTFNRIPPGLIPFPIQLYSMVRHSIPEETLYPGKVIPRGAARRRRGM